MSQTAVRGRYEPGDRIQCIVVSAVTVPPGDEICVHIRECKMSIQVLIPYRTVPLGYFVDHDSPGLDVKLINKG